MKHLDEFEQRMEKAAQEVRQSAKHAVPPPLETDARRALPRGWLIFAAAFGVVIVTLGVLPMISNPDDSGPASGSTPSTSPVPASTTVPEPVTTSPTATTVPPVVADCSAAGLPMPAEQDGLPTAVADARRAIAAAAIACDFEALEALASPDFVTSFGGGGFEMIPMWEEQGTYPALALLVELFDTPYAFEDYDGLPRHYYWPSAFVYDSWDEIPPADMEALLTVYTQEELDQAAAFGSYALWRIGITETGEWRFFVAGD
jgi:hypothetical protein